MYIRLLIVTFAFSISLGNALAQQEWNDAELEAVEIEIVKERQITLPQANRHFEKVPPRSSEPIRPPITYDFRAFNFQVPQISPAIRPLKLKQEAGSDVYGNYLSVGYGNYASPYLEAFINSRRDKKKLVGAHAWLNSSGKGPVDGKNSAGGTAGVSLYGKTFGKAISLSGRAGYEHRFTHFYGYPEAEVVDRDSIRQSYNIFSLGGSLSNTRNSDFAYDLGVDFSYLQDKFDAQETDVNINFKSSYAMTDKSSIRLSADYYIISRKDTAVEAKPRSLFQASGGYEFSPLEDLTVRAGLVLAFENDTIDKKNLHIYPDVYASYKLSPSVDLIGSLSGGIDKVSLHTLSAENWWVAPAIDIFHTNRTFDLQAGINAKLGNKVQTHAGISLALLKNLYHFVNSPEDQAKFITIYDEGTTRRSNIFASLSYAQSEKAKFMVRGDYYAYQPGRFEDVWHRPTYKLTGNASYNLYDKLLFDASLILQGGMKALDPHTLETINLDGAVDLNLKAEYLFSDTFSFFAQLNNITSTQYPVFLYYPVRGFQATVGITWSF